MTTATANETTVGQRPESSEVGSISWRQTGALWLSRKPADLSDATFETLLSRQLDVCAVSYPTLGYFSLLVVVPLCIVTLIPLDTFWGKAWVAAQGLELVAVTAGTICLRNRSGEGLRDHSRLQWIAAPSTLIPGFLWGSLGALSWMRSPELASLGIAVGCLHLLASYYWAFGLWRLCHIYVGLGVVTMMMTSHLATMPVAVALTLFLPAYGFTVCFFSYGVVDLFARNHLSRLLVQDQASVISLLLREFEEGAHDWLWETDTSGRLTYAPPRMEQASGAIALREGDRLSSLPLRGRINSDDFDDLMRSGRPFTNLTVEFLPQSGDTRARSWELTGHPRFDDNGSFIGYRGIGSDTSERTHLRFAELAQERYAAFVTMTGSLAHDFNNLLMSILGSVELIAVGITDVEDLALANRALRACSRARGITAQLLSYSQLDVGLSPESFLVEDTIAEIIEDVRQLGFGQVTYTNASSGQEESYDEELWVHVDHTQFARAFRNLVDNAIHALHDHPDPAVAVSARAAPDSMVAVVVSDNGPGISPDVTDRIFEPCFTTRREVGGSGLGLSMVQGFAVQSGGLVDFSSGDSGSTFTLLIPAGLPKEREANGAGPGSNLEGEVVLVVEDEPDVADVVRRMLQAAQARVLVSPTIASAQSTWTRSGSEITLVLCDLMLPDGRGFEFVSWLRQQPSQVPVGYMSGFSDQLPDTVDPSLRESLLRKPFAAKELVSFLSGRRSGQAD